MKPVLDRLKTEVLLADGAMGTLLYERGANVTSCVELLNLTHPAIVEQVHRDYLSAGAQLVTSNSFAANRLKLAAHDLSSKVEALNLQGMALAREAAGGNASVAASVGPLGALMQPLGVVTRDQASDVFAEHIAAVACGSPDILLLETFGSAEEAALALSAAKKIVPSLPVLVSLSVGEDGRTVHGDPLGASFHRLIDAGADALGINCAVGPQGIYDALAPVIGCLSCPVSVMPNAGYPQRMADRTIYASGPSYFRRFAADFVMLGANIVGGCCGTKPEHVAAMALEVLGAAPQPRKLRPQIQPSRTRAVTVAQTAPSRAEGGLGSGTSFERKLGRQFVMTADVVAPGGVNYEASVRAAKALEAAGIDAVHITDNVTARVNMSGIALAQLIMRHAAVATILHLNCRDRNLLGLESELLGAAALGITAVLALTGNPSSVGDFPKATSVFDVTSSGLTRIIHALNQGEDHAGNHIGMATRFRIGTAVNPLARDPQSEMAKLREKIDSGADFAITQPIFNVAGILPFVDRTGKSGLPLIVGIMPLRSYRNAEYLHNEVPGMDIPVSVRDRLRTCADVAREGIAIASELVVELRRTPGVAGVYLAVQDSFEVATEILTRVKTPA